MENLNNPILKSVIQFEPSFLSKNKISKEIKVEAQEKKKIISQTKYINPIEEEINNIEKKLHLKKRNYNEINNKKVLYEANDLIASIEEILKVDNEGLNEGGKISLLNVICFILKKINKKIIENEILKTYFLTFDKLVNLFLPLNVNINDIMTRLVGMIKYEKKGKNKILFKEGDKGDKFYIILKGEVGILIPQEKIIKCCPSEYLKYLINLFLYQEKSLLSKLLIVNREKLKFDERCFYSLMAGLKFYHFFIYYSGTKKIYKSPIDFLHTEYKINNYIKKKEDFSPEEAFHTLNLTNISEYIYDYYYQLLNNIQSTFLTALNENYNEHKITSYSSITNLSEFGEYVKEYENDKKKFKEHEFLDKLYRINELNAKYTTFCKTEEYINRINCEKQMKEIRNNIKNNFIKINENEIDFKYYNYFEVNQLKDKNIFGELALINPNQKRTATIIIKENCHFGILEKESYEISIKLAQEKLRMRNLLYFTNGFIFKGLTNNYFLNNYFFRFKKKSYNSGEYLFRAGEKREKIYFIVSGELQLGRKMTLKKITEIIDFLSDNSGWDDGGISSKYYKESVDFIKYFEENENYFRLYVLKKKEIAGLDDMAENNIYLFDCIANSLEPTEVYELDYQIYKSCLEERIVEINNNNYVSTKKDLLIDRLYKLRDSIANNEFNRIKIYIINEKNLEYSKEIKENGIKSEKKKKNHFNLNNTIFHKNTHSLIEENKLNSNNNNNETNYLNRQLPTLNSLGNFNSIDKKEKSKFFLNRTEYNTFKSFTKNNSKEPKKIIEKENSSNDNNLFLINIENEKAEKEKEVHKLLKSDDLNLNKIALYLNKNKFSFPKLPNNSSNKVSPKKYFSKSRKPFKKMAGLKLEPDKTFSIKKRFKFNNQKIFSSLLNQKKIGNENKIKLTIQNNSKDFENDKESFIKEKNNIKNINTIEKTKNINLFDRINLKTSNNKLNSFSKRYIKNDVSEDYKDIFLVDCLCLDKWEEKNNKLAKKKTWILKGKKFS